VNVCLGAQDDIVPEVDCQLACFISHHQAAATFQAQWLGREIERRLEAEGKLLTRVWIDKQQMPRTRACMRACDLVSTSSCT
jgi:hypothetical protein